jgi:hypothetical protein
MRNASNSRMASSSSRRPIAFQNAIGDNSSRANSRLRDRDRGDEESKYEWDAIEGEGKTILPPGLGSNR